MNVGIDFQATGIVVLVKVKRTGMMFVELDFVVTVYIIDVTDRHILSLKSVVVIRRLFDASACPVDSTFRILLLKTCKTS